MPFAPATHLPFARVRSAAPQQHLHLLWCPRPQGGNVAVKDEDEGQYWNQPAKDESGRRSPLPGVQWRGQDGTDAQDQVCQGAGEAAVLQLEDGEALTRLDRVAQDGLRQRIVKVVEREVEQAQCLFSIVPAHEMLRCGAGVDALALVGDKRVLASNLVPRVDVGVQVGEDEADRGLVKGAQVSVDDTLN